MEFTIKVSVENKTTAEQLKDLIGTSILGVYIKTIEEEKEQEETKNKSIKKVIKISPNYENIYKKEKEEEEDITNKVIKRLKERNEKLKATINKHGFNLRLGQESYKIERITIKDIGELKNNSTGIKEGYKVYTIYLEKEFNTNREQLVYILNFWDLFGIPVIKYENNIPLFGKNNNIPITCNGKEINIFSPFEYEYNKENNTSNMEDILDTINKVIQERI